MFKIIEGHALDAFMEISTLAMLELVSQGAHLEFIHRHKKVDSVTGKRYHRFIDTVSGRAFDVFFVDSDMAPDLPSGVMCYKAFPIQTDIKVTWDFDAWKKSTT